MLAPLGFKKSGVETLDFIPPKIAVAPQLSAMLQAATLLIAISSS